MPILRARNLKATEDFCIIPRAQQRAISSVGERLVHTEEVGGSKPPSPIPFVSILENSLFYKEFFVFAVLCPIPEMMKVDTLAYAPKLRCYTQALD